MKVQCSGCESNYKIDEKKVPDVGAKIQCPKCEDTISIKNPEPPELAADMLTECVESESDKVETKNTGKSEKENCPYCDKEIVMDSTICRHCAGDLTANTTIASPPKKSDELIGTLLLVIPLVSSALIMYPYVTSTKSYQSSLFITATAIATVIMTAILAAVEANNLNFGKSLIGKRESGPAGIFFSFLLLWAVAYPYYLFLRGQKGQKNHVGIGIIVTLLFIGSLFLMSNPLEAITNPEISMVKNGILSKYPQKTVGSAVDGFMGDCKWESGVAQDGTKFVNARGKILYDQKKVTAVLQFKIDKYNDTFQINALKINGKPQNMFMIWALMDKMYSS